MRAAVRGARARPTAHRALPPSLLEARKGAGGVSRWRLRWGAALLAGALLLFSALYGVGLGLGVGPLRARSTPLDDGDYEDEEGCVTRATQRRGSTRTAAAARAARAAARCPGALRPSYSRLALSPYRHEGHAHAAHAAPFSPSGWRTSRTETLQCPRFSGPGWRPDYHPNLPLEGASEASRLSSEAPAADARRVPLSPLPAGAVRLAPAASPLAEAEASNLEYLKLLEPDRLVWSFRQQAGVAQPAGATPYGGWESPGSELRGHFVGHYLSAAAAALRATGDEGVGERLRAVVAALAACQSAEGYLSAFPTELLDRFENQQPVWAPYYTLHKVLMGLRDAAALGGVAAAQPVAERFAAYIAARARRVVAQRGLDWWRGCLNQEYGGVAEALRAVGGPAIEPSAQLWDKPCFHGPLAAGVDILAGLHANAHLPMLPGAMARFEATGEEAFLESAQRFFALLNNTRAYATGGTSHGELWHPPHELGSGLGGPHAGGTESAEQCATHNALRTATWLLRARTGASVRAAYAEYVERATLNGILGSQRGSDPGRYLYMYPLGAGVSKGGRSQWRETGWSTPFESFWCCTGTMIEAFARFGEGLYLQHARARRLYALHYASSSVQWAAAEAVVTQTADSPSWTRPRPNASLRVHFKVEPAAAGGAPVTAALALRIPGWAAQARASLDGGASALAGDAPQPGRFLIVQRAWAAGEAGLSLELPLGDAVRAERILDDREPFRRLHALLWGPLVLGGLTDGERALGCAGAAGELLRRCVRPVPDEARAQLVSLRAPGAARALLMRNVSAGAPQALLWAPAPAERPVARRRSGGSDAAAAATWRMMPVADGSVALEALDRPGLFLAPAGEGGGELRLMPGEPLDAAEAASPPLAARWARSEEGACCLRLESRLYPGTALAVPTVEGGAPIPARTAAAAERGEPLARDEPLETLPDVAFWALSAEAGRKVLMIPLSDIIDETYSAYWEINA